MSAAAGLAGLLAVATLGLAPAQPVVAAPACATTPVQASWTTHYADGSYRLDTLILDGLQQCAGASLLVSIGEDDAHMAQIPVMVGADTLAVDVSPLALPAADIDHLSLVLTDEVSSPTQEPQVSGASAERARRDTGAGTADGVAALPTTGMVVPAGLAALAAGLVALGAALRRRVDRGVRARA